MASRFDQPRGAQYGFRLRTVANPNAAGEPHILLTVVQKPQGGEENTLTVAMTRGQTTQLIRELKAQASEAWPD